MSGRSRAETGKRRQGHSEGRGWSVQVAGRSLLGTPHPRPGPGTASGHRHRPPCGDSSARPVTFPHPHQGLAAAWKPRPQLVGDAGPELGCRGAGPCRLGLPEPRWSRLSTRVARMATSPAWRLLPASSPLRPPKHTEAPHSSKKLFLSFLNNVKMPREGLNQKPLQGPGWGGEGETRDGGSGSPEACGPV